MIKSIKSYKCRCYLFCLYKLVELSSYEIAKEINTSPYTILRWLKKFNIRRRTYKEINTGKKAPMFGKHLTKEHKRKISETLKGRVFSKETKQKMSIAANNIWNKKISIRLYLNKTWLQNQYITQKKPAIQIAKECGVAPLTISRWLQRFNIAKRIYTENNAGINNPFYGRHHTEETKKKISNTNKRKFSGKNNPRWKEEWKELSRIRKHRRIKQALPRINIHIPLYCPICGKKEEKRKLDLMNLNHTYRENLLDYYYLCQHCHNVYHSLVGFKKSKKITPDLNLLPTLLNLSTREEREQLLKESILKVLESR